MNTFYNFYSKILSLAFIFAFAFAFAPMLSAQTTLWSETFETQGNMGARYTVVSEFNDGTSDHFQRTDGSDIGNASGPYSGIPAGEFFFATEDTDDNGGDGFDYKAITFNQINSSGWTNLSFTGLFAKGNNGSVYDYVDGAVVSYSIDGGANFTQAIKFRYVNSQNDAFNEQLVAISTINQDCVLSGGNGGFISSANCDAEVPGPPNQNSNTLTGLSTAFTSLGFSIPDAPTIDIMIELVFESTNEEFAFDNFVIMGMAPAPVELTRFTGEKKTESVLLEWETATEIDNEYFFLERSTDGRAFSTIAKLDGAINSYQNTSYDYLDTDLPEAHEIYYRLKQVDLDGTFEYSEIVAVENKVVEEGFTIFPNPIEASDRLNVISKLEGQFAVEIVDFNGRVVYADSKRLDPGTWDLPISDLSSGTYILRLSSSNQIHMQRFVKM